jgi:PBP1b-binding outer membrane lipoprotein LpoB
MKTKIWKIAPALAAALLFAGCSSTPTEDPQSRQGAEVSEA